MKSWKKRIRSGLCHAKKNNSGLTLVELIVAIFILSLIAVPLFLSFATSAKITYRSREIGDATLAAENIAEYLIGSDFSTTSVSGIASGLDSTFAVTDTEITLVYQNGEGNLATPSIESLSIEDMIFADIVEADGTAVDVFQIQMDDIVMGTTTLDAVVTLDRESGEASAINSTLLADSTLADCMFAQSKGAGVVSDPDVLSFKEFVEAAKMTGLSITNTDGSTITSYDDNTLYSLASVLDVDRTIEIEITKYASDVVATDPDADVGDEVDKWSVVITYSYLYTYTGSTTFTYETSYQVIDDSFEVDVDAWPNIQVLFYPWYHGDEEIYIRNNNEQDANDAGFNLYLAKQEHTDISNLSTLEATYGSSIDVRLYNERSITINEPKIYSNIGTSFTGSSGVIMGSTYYRIYQMEFFYRTAEFESVESLLVESARNRYYNMTIELTVDGETDSIYTFETTKLQ